MKSHWDGVIRYDKLPGVLKASKGSKERTALNRKGTHLGHRDNLRALVEGEDVHHRKRLDARHRRHNL